MRKETIERIFADAKEKYEMRYTPYRGLRAVSCWVKLKYTAMNLKKLAMWKWKDGPSSLFLHWLQAFHSLFRAKNPIALVSQ
jgi:hypothetical protein